MKHIKPSTNYQYDDKGNEIPITPETDEPVELKLNWRMCPKCKSNKNTIQYRDEKYIDGVLCQKCDVVWNVNWDIHPPLPLYDTLQDSNGDKERKLTDSELNIVVPKIIKMFEKLEEKNKNK